MAACLWSSEAGVQGRPLRPPGQHLLPHSCQFSFFCGFYSQLYLKMAGLVYQGSRPGTSDLGEATRSCPAVVVTHGGWRGVPYGATVLMYLQGTRGDAYWSDTLVV